MTSRLYDAVIVGAGPAGLYSAGRCEDHGLNVLVLEEHDGIGNPLHCSGLISANLASFVGIEKDFVEHRVRGAILNSPGGYSLRLEKSGTAAYVIDRIRFDSFLASRISSTIETGSKVTDISLGKDAVSVKAGGKTFLSRMLIACDGANSTIRKQMHQTPRETLSGIFALTNHRNESDFVEMWYDKNLCDGFMWKIPRGHSTEYGMIGSRVDIQALRRFFRLEKIQQISGGLIPLGPPRTYFDRLILAGDAAAQVKPWSGGGVIYSLTAAELAADVCRQAVQADDFSSEFLSRYEHMWKRKIGARIRTGMLGRRIFKRLSNRQIDIAMRSANRVRMLMNKLDMDFLLT